MTTIDFLFLAILCGSLYSSACFALNILLSYKDKVTEKKIKRRQNAWRLNNIFSNIVTIIAVIGYFVVIAVIGLKIDSFEIMGVDAITWIYISFAASIFEAINTVWTHFILRDIVDYYKDYKISEIRSFLPNFKMTTLSAILSVIVFSPVLIFFISKDAQFSVFVFCGLLFTACVLIKNYVFKDDKDNKQKEEDRTVILIFKYGLSWPRVMSLFKLINVLKVGFLAISTILKYLKSDMLTIISIFSSPINDAIVFSLALEVFFKFPKVDAIKINDTFEKALIARKSSNDNDSH